MRAWAFLVLLAACTGSTPAAPAPTVVEVEGALPDGASQLAVRAEAVAWGKCPPNLPPGCEMTVLEGDPRKPQLFTVRFRTPGSFEMKPHWHPRNERVTVLEGKIGVGFGDAIDRENVTWFGPGDYYVNAKEAHHFVLTDAPAVVQVTGIGPWKANYLDAE
jgi:hypothetical protein